MPRIVEGSALRIRTTLMTVSAMIASLFSILWSIGPGAQIAYAQPSSTICSNTPPTAAQYPAFFEREIDASVPFTLEMIMTPPPPGWNVSLIFVARDGNGKLIGINPTLIAVPGSTLHLHLSDCLRRQDIATLQSYDPLDPALPDVHTPGNFDAIQAAEMEPTGYVNLHTHGLHGAPLAGTSTSPAGDEVLATFVSPFSQPSSDGSVSATQEYAIKVPADQDPGLYWYHPHMHGEAQPQVFLGLSGAIVVVPKQAGDPGGHGAIAAELAAHKDNATHPAVFIVRDYPVEHFPIPEPPINATAIAAVLPSSKALQTGQTTSRRHRANFLSKTQGGDMRTDGVGKPQHLTASTNALCTLFRKPGTQTPCLPDGVTSQATDMPSLGTLVTVNGRITEAPQGGGPDALVFDPLKATGDKVIRVLNASANTYLKISLTNTPPNSISLGSAAAQTIPSLPLLQLRRDGAPVRGNLRRVDSVVLPPGGRAEVSLASPSSKPVALVSQYFNTGPAGDLVPPRTLAFLNTAPAPLEPAVASALPEVSARFRGAYAGATAGETRRALAFFEQDRNCPMPQPGQPEFDCGTSFYLMDITPSAIGTAGVKTSVTMAVPFALPMTLTGFPSRDFFQPSGLLKSSIPAIQVSLEGRHEVDEEWDVYNFTAEAHAFHIHQLGFRVASTCSPRYLAAQSLDVNCLVDQGGKGDEDNSSGLILDVVNVPPALSQPTSDASAPPLVYPGHVHLRVPFTDDIVGNFVMHCHLLEHEDNGMMMGVQVWKNTAPRDTSSPSPAATMAMP